MPPQDGGGPPPRDGGRPPPQDGGAGDAGSTACFGSTPSTGSGQAEAIINAPTAYTPNFSGNFTSISGGTVAIGYEGLYSAMAGNVAIYAWDSCNNVWSLQQTVTGSNTGPYDLFGSSVDLDGDLLIVGANYKDDGSGSTGAAYTFVRSGTTWTQKQNMPIPTAGGERYGFALAQSDSTALITSPQGKDPHSTITYTGVVSVYQKANNVLTYEAAVVPSEAQSWDDFGYSIDLEGNAFIAGAPGAIKYGSVSTTKGKAWIFTGSGAVWAEAAYLLASDGQQNDWFGKAVAISPSGTTAIVGAPLADSAQYIDSGAAYVFTLANGTWSQTAKLTASDASASGQFGFSVDVVSDTRVLVGASGAGKIYSFTLAGGTWSEDMGNYVGCSGTQGFTMGVSGNLMVTSKPSAWIFDISDPNMACVQ
jgi:hypothetical protein